MLLSSFTHRRQRHESDCLVACVEMVLAYLHVPATYEQVAKRLRTQWFGTPFGNVNIQTVDWPHWHGEVTYHAVVVTGIDPIAETVYLHDPFFAEAPLELALNTFLIGWEEQDRQYAVIALAPIV